MGMFVSIGTILHPPAVDMLCASAWAWSGLGRVAINALRSQIAAVRLIGIAYSGVLRLREGS